MSRLGSLSPPHEWRELFSSVWAVPREHTAFEHSPERHRVDVGARNAQPAPVLGAIPKDGQLTLDLHPGPVPSAPFFCLHPPRGSSTEQWVELAAVKDEAVLLSSGVTSCQPRCSRWSRAAVKDELLETSRDFRVGLRGHQRSLDQGSTVAPVSIGTDGPQGSFQWILSFLRDTPENFVVPDDAKLQRLWTLCPSVLSTF